MPLGYQIDAEQHYQIEASSAALVQEAFRRYADGESVRAIIASFNMRGVRTAQGRLFTKNSFQTLLKNRRYLGEYRYKDTVIPDAIPAIITPEIFDRVQNAVNRIKSSGACENGCQLYADNKTVLRKMRCDDGGRKREKVIQAHGTIIINVGTVNVMAARYAI